MEFLVIWAVFAVACYYVAKSKGRNAAAWAFAGLVFGVFALIVLAFMPKRQVFQHPYSMQPGPYGQIPNYGQSPQYGQQPGYGMQPQYGTQQGYQQPTFAPQGANPAPQYVPPPIHPQHQSSSAPPVAPAQGSEHQRVVGSVSVELARLGALHRSGQMSDADFDAAKRRLLGK